MLSEETLNLDSTEPLKLVSRQSLSHGSVGCMTEPNTSCNILHNLITVHDLFTVYEDYWVLRFCWI